MRKVFLLLSMAMPLLAYSGPCNNPDDRDSAGRRCGGRAASVIPGGSSGGDGKYTDSSERDRVYGKGNDIYDSDYSPLNKKPEKQTNQWGL